MSDSKINSSHTSFMNYTHNPHLVKNNQSYNFSNTANNTMTRKYSNENGFLSYRNMTPLNPLTQSSDEIRYQQLMNQKRLQEQQRLQLLQRTKMNNINYNNLNNINYMANNNTNRNTNINYANVNNNNVSRNPNLTYNNDIPNESKNKKEVNYAEVNILNQLVRSNNQIRTFEVQNPKNTQPMNNLRNRNNANNINNLNNLNQIRNIELNPTPLKQSHSQQVIRNTPSMKNEISAQQTLNQKFLDSSGNEETQSQFERESNNQQQIRDANLKIENEKEKENSETNQQTEKPSENTPQQNKNNSAQKAQLTPQSEIPESTQQEEEDDDEEDPEAEKLFRLETGLIIFRNGLLRG